MKTAVLGLQYGDEGKGRVVGYFSKQYDWAVRFNGGGNAGHTVYDEQGRKFKLHHIPCGAVFGKKVALDTGMVINMETLEEEIATLKAAGIESDIHISENVHLIQHKHLEDDAQGSGIGSTKRGIAYVYADRSLRKGIRASEVLRKETKGLVMGKRGVVFTPYRGLPPIKPGESAIYEGAQGIMLDVDYGCYPYVTSSNLLPNMAHKIEKTIGVMKAYVTRVGDGPPYDEDMPEIRERGQEYGTTTGRPRNCYWNDLDQLEYAISIVQPDEIVVTKLDILGGMDSICVYKDHKPIKIGNLDDYKQFLVDTFPQVKWFSESPDGDMTKAR